jgi:hypothetical protein
MLTIIKFSKHLKTIKHSQYNKIAQTKREKYENLCTIMFINTNMSLRNGYFYTIIDHYAFYIFIVSYL